MFLVTETRISHVKTMFDLHHNVACHAATDDITCLGGQFGIDCPSVFLKIMKLSK